MKKTTGLLFLLLLAACGGHPHDKQEIEAAMKRYDRLIQNMDADSIALTYTTDGDLGGIAHGRDSIRKFLSSFKNVKVLEVSSTTDSLTLDHDSAYQTGHYRQMGIVDGKDTFRVKGSYRTHWVWTEGWQIKRMTTQPEN